MSKVNSPLEYRGGKDYLSSIFCWVLLSGVILIILVLLQQRGSAMGSIMGGSGGGESYLSRRGIEKNYSRQQSLSPLPFLV